MKEKYTRDELKEALNKAIKFIKKTSVTDGIETINIKKFMEEKLEHSIFSSVTLNGEGLHNSLHQHLDKIGFFLDFEEGVYVFTDKEEEASIKKLYKNYPDRFYKQEKHYGNDNRFTKLFYEILKNLPSRKLLSEDREVSDNNIFSNNKNIEEMRIEQMNDIYDLETNIVKWEKRIKEIMPAI